MPIYLRLRLTTTPRHSSFSSTEPSLYEIYLQKIEEYEEYQRELEETKSQKMYQAWKESSSSPKQPTRKKSAGVTVVQTLARETNREQTRLKSTQLYEEAQTYLERAAYEEQHPQAMVLLANKLLLSEQSPSSLDDQVIPLYKKAAEQHESKEACYNLGTLYWEQKNQRDEAMKWFEKAVSMGDADAQYFVGVQRDSLELIQLAASQDHGGALYYLALHQLEQIEASKTQDSEAIDPAMVYKDFREALEKAIDVGDNPDAWNFRGHARWKGEYGYTEDARRAFEDFLEASDRGQAEAAVTAGAILHQGANGLPKNQEWAFQLYQHAGELGSKDGWRNVVACYWTGEGVKQNMDTAKYIAETMLREEKEE